MDKLIVIINIIDQLHSRFSNVPAESGRVGKRDVVRLYIHQLRLKVSVAELGPYPGKAIVDTMTQVLQHYRVNAVVTHILLMHMLEH